jgi:hypothetical protein
MAKPYGINIFFHSNLAFASSRKFIMINQKFYLILNIAVGGNFGGVKGVDEAVWPQRIEVVGIYCDGPLPTVYGIGEKNDTLRIAC